MARRPSPRPSRTAVSIQDVAAAADVSIATVSRVLNNRALVATQTCTRVQDAIDRLGYVPNVFARGLIRRSSRTLGIVLPDFYGEVCSLLLRGADAQARRHGFQLTVTAAVPRGDADMQEHGATGLIDGLAILRPAPDDIMLREARASSLPTVVLDSAITAPNVDQIAVDHGSGVREALTHLLDGNRKAGHADRLCLVAGPRNARDTQRTVDEFTTAMRSLNIPARNDEVAFGTFTEEWGRAWAFDRDDRGTLRGTAVLAGNDEIALGILRAAAERGLRIPHDLRIVGFDDTRLCAIARPRLSSVRIPLAELGAAAVTLLLERIADAASPARVVSLLPRLMIRESSALL